MKSTAEASLVVITNTIEPFAVCEIGTHTNVDRNSAC